MLILAILGAWAGDALGGRLGLELLRIGDFRLVAASLGAWAGIGLVALVSVLGPTRSGGPRRADGGRSMSPRLAGGRGEDRLAVFLRGLVIGAFVGAFIAGSAAVRRLIGR